MKFLVFFSCALLALAVAQPTKNENWKSAMDEMVDHSRSECSQKNDEVACMKFKVFNLLDQIFSKDNFKASINGDERQEEGNIPLQDDPSHDIIGRILISLSFLFISIIYDQSHVNLYDDIIFI